MKSPRVGFACKNIFILPPFLHGKSSARSPPASKRDSAGDRRKFRAIPAIFGALRPPRSWAKRAPRSLEFSTSFRIRFRRHTVDREKQRQRGRASASEARRGFAPHPLESPAHPNLSGEM